MSLCTWFLIFKSNTTEKKKAHVAGDENGYESKAFAFSHKLRVIVNKMKGRLYAYKISDFYCKVIPRLKRPCQGFFGPPPGISKQPHCRWSANSSWIQHLLKTFIQQSQWAIPFWEREMKTFPSKAGATAAAWEPLLTFMGGFRCISLLVLNWTKNIQLDCVFEGKMKQVRLDRLILCTK